MTPPRRLPPLITDLALSYRLRPTHEPAKGLVVLMHGVGSNETSLSGIASLFSENIVVARVRSLFAMSPSSFCAFPVSFTADGPVIDAEAAETSRNTLARFIDELQKRTGVPANRTLVAGFSQGGIMSASLALTHPDMLAGFAILSGRILPQTVKQLAPREALAHLRVLVTHGENDEILPPIWADRSAEIINQIGLSLTRKQYPVQHEITQEIADDFVNWAEKIIGGNMHTMSAIGFMRA